MRQLTVTSTALRARIVKILRMQGPLETASLVMRTRTVDAAVVLATVARLKEEGVIEPSCPDYKGQPRKLTPWELVG